MIRARGRRDERIAPEVVGVAALVIHNIVIHRVFPTPADAALNIISATGATLAARRSGHGWQDLGMQPDALRSGVVIGSAAGAASASIVALAGRLPGARGFFHDERVATAERHAVPYHAAFRVPIATALAEEVLFRGVMHALFARHRSMASTQRWTSVLFGAWHVLPTLDTFEGNPAKGLAPGAGGRVSAVLVTVAATAAAGGFFSWLRIRSDSVAAPVIAHAAISVSAYAMGRSVVKSGPPEMVHEQILERTSCFPQLPRRPGRA